MCGSPGASSREFRVTPATSNAAANAALAEHGLKARSYSVLALTAEDLRPTQRELAEFLRLDPSQVVVLVDELERLLAFTA